MILHQCTIAPAKYDSPAKRKVFQRFVGNILIICQGLGKNIRLSSIFVQSSKMMKPLMMDKE